MSPKSPRTTTHLVVDSWSFVTVGSPPSPQFPIDYCSKLSTERWPSVERTSDEHLKFEEEGKLQVSSTVEEEGKFLQQAQQQPSTNMLFSQRLVPTRIQNCTLCVGWIVALVSTIQAQQRRCAGLYLTVVLLLQHTDSGKDRSTLTKKGWPFLIFSSYLNNNFLIFNFSKVVCFSIWFPFRLVCVTKDADSLII